jgi:hypothetical protein
MKRLLFWISVVRVGRSLYPAPYIMWILMLLPFHVMGFIALCVGNLLTWIADGWREAAVGWKTGFFLHILGMKSRRSWFRKVRLAHAIAYHAAKEGKQSK